MHQKRTLRCSTNLVAARMGKKYKMFRLLMTRLMRFVAVRRLECRHMLIPSSHLCRQTLFSGYCVCVLARHMQIMTDKNNDREKSENDTLLRAVCRHFLWLSVAGEPLQTIITFIEKTNANAACCKRVLHTAEWVTANNSVRQLCACSSAKNIKRPISRKRSLAAENA